MKRRILALCVALTLGLASQAPAAPITFTHEGSGSGTLNGVPFGVSDFVITAVGDNDGRNHEIPPPTSSAQPLRPLFRTRV